ncbi:amidohydrolase family protein [Streptomyces niveus]|uniref:hypothetical protein n=1 Tax=Streptomyces niveus TaxID=193462 RepID=UPI0036305589
MGGFSVTVTESVPRLPDGALTAGTVTLPQEVRGLVEHDWPIDRAVNLASRAPASYGLTGAGELTVGGPANLIVTDEDGTVERFLVNGEEFAA